MHEYDKLFIGGEWVEPSGKGTIDVISPHSEELVGRVPEGTEADVDRRSPPPAPHSTRRLAPPVARGAHRRRPEVLRGLRGADDRHGGRHHRGDGLADHVLAARAVAGAVADAQHLPQIAAEYPWEERRAGVLGGEVIVRREAVGVVGAIVPWNVPQFVTMSKLAPALLSGCAIVIKPSPETPLDAFLMAELLEEAGIPKGVVSVVPAGREVGEHLVRHPGVDKIAFTGSTAAGRRIAGDLRRAAQAREPRARRQVGRDHPRRRRSRGDGARA